MGAREQVRLAGAGRAAGGADTPVRLWRWARSVPAHAAMSEELDLLSALIEHEDRCSRARDEEQRCAAAECKRGHNEQQLRQHHIEQQLALQPQQLQQVQGLQLQQLAPQQLGQQGAEEETKEEVVEAVAAEAAGDEQERQRREQLEENEQQHEHEHELGHAHQYSQEFQQRHEQHYEQHYELHGPRQQLEAYPEQDDAFGACETGSEVTGHEEADPVGDIDVVLSDDDELCVPSQIDGEESRAGLRSPVKVESMNGCVFGGSPPSERDAVPGNGKLEGRRRWLPEDDALLARLVDTGAYRHCETGKTNWKAISAQFEGKSGQQCKQRFDALKEGLIKGKWTEEEDQRLREAIARHGTKWIIVARLVPGRTGKQCRDRYLSRLNPVIKLGDWTPEEEEVCIAAYRAYGNKWVTIQKLLPRRACYSIKWKISMLKKSGRIDD